MIYSPITNRPTTKLIAEFPVEKIINAYKAQKINVDRFFTGHETIYLYECVDTGYRFYYPFTVFGDGKFYEEIESNFKGYYIKNRWEHKTILPSIQTHETVLEIGCGSGHFLEMLRQKNVNAEGIELNEEAIKKATEKGLKVKYALLEQYAEERQEYYDVVCAYQVLEHITTIKQFVNDALKLLKPGGRLIIAVPNNNPYLFRYDKWHTLNLPPHHAGLWNKGAFEQLQKYFNMSAESITIEPLVHYKEWFLIQKDYYKQNNKLKYLLCSLIPRPLYKFTLKLLKNHIQGRNIIATYRKK